MNDVQRLVKRVCEMGGVLQCRVLARSDGIDHPVKDIAAQFIMWPVV